MAEQPILPEARVRPQKFEQRCPNCEGKADVGAFVAGALVRCARCGVRFEVRRGARTPSFDKVVEEAIKAAHAEEEMAAVPVTVRGQAAVKPPPELPRMDGFVVHERLGQGGMGEVYRCTRIADGRALAVKVLSASLAAVPDYVRRFDREAAAMAQLSHPGIVKLLGRGKSGPHCWIAMELIDGISLRTYAYREKPSTRLLAKLLAQVGHALAYAHARAVVHRDLKPDNVLVLSDGRTKILDFGLAGLHTDGAEVLTQSNVAMGTSNYMAPEQRKDARRADHRADLYSFGVMVYELLTNELPVGRFAPPSRLVAGLDKGWDAIVERCLDQDPAGRPHSALELAHSLESLAGLAEPMQLAPRTRRRTTRSRMWSWIGLGAGAAVILGTAGLQILRDHGRKSLASEMRMSSPAGRALPRPPRVVR